MYIVTHSWSSHYPAAGSHSCSSAALAALFQPDVAEWWRRHDHNGPRCLPEECSVWRPYCRKQTRYTGQLVVIPHGTVKVPSSVASYFRNMLDRRRLPCRGYHAPEHTGRPVPPT